MAADAEHRLRAVERRDASGGGATALSLRLAHRVPLAADRLLVFLGGRCVAGVEEMRGATYRRALRLPHGHGVVALTPRGDHVACVLRLADLRDLGAAVARCRRLLDLDADPVAVDAHLAADPALAPRVAAAPGVRVPGSVDGFEAAVRAVAGQQVSVAGAATVLGRLTAAAAAPLAVPDATLTRVFPDRAEVAAAPDDAFAMPAARRRTLRALAGAELDLEPGADREATRAALLALPGVGPWTAGYVAMRALGDPDAWLPTDLGVRKGLAALGDPDPERWRPWRAYAMQHVWAAGA